jgi:hypothetical protein
MNNNKSWILGIEQTYGWREDKDGANVSDNRSQFSTRFSF